MSVLSASTITSSSSKAFSFGSTTSTSSSQYSVISGTKTHRNLLSELLDSEATYLNDLKIIDSKIAPLWMKQTTQTAPDFTELIKNVRDIILANKRFYMKLARCAGNTHAARELGNILIQWVTDLEVPYSNYARSYISNLNDRTDILANRSITQLLKDLSNSASYDISLDSLFAAPIQHLKYYQDIYTNLLNAEPNHYDINDLNKATRYLKAILAISQEQPASKPRAPSHIYTQHKLSGSARRTTEKKTSYIGQEEDFFSYYTEADELSHRGNGDDPSFLENGYYGTNWNGYSNNDDEDLSTIKPRTVKILDAIPADPKVATITSTSTSSPSPIKVDTSAQIQMAYIQPAMAKIVVLDDETSPDHDSLQRRSLTPANSTNNMPPNQQVVNSAPTPTPPPPPPKSQTPDPTPTSSPPKPETLDPTSASTPPRTSVSPSNPSYKQNNAASPSSTISPPQQQKTLAPPSNEPARPISPRAVQVQQAVNPVAAMQAIPQKTDDYFGTSTKPLPARKESVNTNLPERSSSSTPDATVLPRTSSIRGSTRNIISTQQTTSPSVKSNNSQSPIPTHSQSIGNIPSSPQAPSHQLVRTSSLKSTELPTGHGTLPPRKSSNNPLPPRKDSNDARPTSSRSTQSSTMTRHQQQSPAMLSPRQQQQPPTPQQEEDQQNSIRQVLYSNNLCEVFHWKDQSWYAVDGQCTVQIRLTFGGRSNVAVLLQPSGQLYLNVWILPNMVVTQPSPTDISVSATMMEQQENYLIHFTHPTDASNLLAMLHRMLHESTRQQPPPSLPTSTVQRQQQRRPEAAAVQLHDDTPSVEDVPQTLKPIFQCKCKLFVQNETSKWNQLGNTAMRISQQLPSQKTHIYIEDDKKKLISSIVRSGNVERLTSKRITFLLTDDNDKSSMVYMIQLTEQNGNRVFDYLKTQNAAHGW